MNTRQRFYVFIVLIISLGASGCGSGQAPIPAYFPTPKLAPTPSSTPIPSTATTVPHWAGETGDNHWGIEFDYNQSAGELENVILIYQDDALHPCSFQVTKITLQPDGSFDYIFNYADLINAMVVNGSISGRFVDTSAISGKIPISLCDTIIYLYEKDLSWTASNNPFASSPVLPTLSLSDTPNNKIPLPPSETPTPSLVPLSNASGSIAYISGQSIYILPADGSKPPSILYSTLDQLTWLRWSPDGKKILFSEFSIGQPANSGLYIMNADGSTPVKLLKINFPPDEKGIAWSPDSQRIAFLEMADIYTVRANGSGLTNITKNPGTYDTVTWSPAGDKIAFNYSKFGQNKKVAYLINPDGTGLAKLAENLSGTLAWSPDGNKIASCASGNANPGLYILNSDGSGQTRLSKDLCFNFAWLPDSQRIVFINGLTQVINIDGSGVTNLKQSGLSLSISPDANWIAVGDVNVIYILSTDGTSAGQSTKVESFSVEPQWRP